MKEAARSRNTRQREYVLETVISRSDHPSADQVYEEIRLRHPHVSRATVYRNLKLLADNGQIRQVLIPGSHSDSYDRRTGPHSHLICVVCGKISDVDLAGRKKDDRELMEKTGYAGVRHSLVFEGICPECQEKLKGTAKK